MPTKQETFDAVVAHARRNPVKAIESGTCMYRTDDGRRCFVGALIPDDRYKPHFEGALLACSELADVLSDLGYDVGFLLRLQSIHDEHEPEDWEDCFMHEAIYSDVTYTPPAA